MADMRFGAFAITHERPEVIARTLKIILEEQSCPPRFVWVVDNSRDSRTEEIIRGLGRSDVGYWRMGVNAGPAGAAAQGLSLLSADGFEWAYWIDDDDPPVFPDTLEQLCRMIQRESSSGRLGGVAAVGQRFSWRTGRISRLRDEELVPGPIEVDVVGGNQHFLVSIPAALQAGLPCRELFFGYEELEFCLRLRRAGYRLLVDGSLMKQLRSHWKRTGPVRRRIVPVVPVHAHWREYYGIRNYIWAMRERFGRSDLALRGAARGLAKSTASWLRGPRYGWSYSRLTLRGILDGYTGRLGVTVVPRPKPPASS